MRLRTTSQGLIVEDRPRQRWVSLAAALERGGSAGSDDLAHACSDVLAFLRAGDDARRSALDLLEAVGHDDAVGADPAEAGLPFEPRSMRAFMVWESHLVDSSRMLVKRFFPPPAARLMTAYERLTGRTFPPLKPKRLFFETPAFYMANHTALVADGQDMWWPSHTRFLDFELELACVLARPLADATPEEARGAVGGWFVLNDWSARDVQAEDARHNVFGPVIKAKTFANSLGCDVVTADDLPDWRTATGRVHVDGELWCEGTTAGAAHDIGHMLAHASAGERLEPGDVISTGTMPGCCGLELDRWIRPGQTVALEIDGIGTLTNRIAAGAAPAAAIRPGAAVAA